MEHRESAPIIDQEDTQSKRPTMSKICKLLGIKVCFDSNKFLQNGKMGMTYFTGERFIIFINRNLSIDEQRITICHEMAHIILGHLMEFPSENIMQPELEAESLGFLIHSYIYNRFLEMDRSRFNKICIKH